MFTFHIWLIPFYFVLSFFSRILSAYRPRWSPLLYRISPVRWDELILLRLPDLPGQLVNLYRYDPHLGREAIREVAQHRYQGWAARWALVRLAQQDAEAVQSLPALAAYAESVDWLNDSSDLPAQLKPTLLTMRDISAEVRSALASDSLTNRVRRLQQARHLSDEALLALPTQGLRLSITDVSGMGRTLRGALIRWGQLIAQALQAAEVEQRELEPIPQVYISDGKPIQPGDRADAMVPFKGRRQLFRELEQAIGGGQGERATLLLFGQRRTGKTSALQQLPRRLGARCIPVFIDLQRFALAESAAGMLAGWAAAICETAIRQHVFLQPPTADDLVQEPFLRFEKWLDDVECALAPRRLLLCLDEFETLEEAFAAQRLDLRVLHMLRSIIQSRQQIDVLLAGSHAIDELPPHWASALITTRPLPISFLEPSDARELIERPVEGFPAIYRPDAVAAIIAATRCQPYLVQVLCALLVERMNRARRMPPESFVEAADVAAVEPLVIERASGPYFSDLWRTQTGGSLGQRILELLSRAPDLTCSSAQIKQAIAADPADLRAAVRVLLRREIIEHSGADYRICVPLVAAYVRQETQF